MAEFIVVAETVFINREIPEDRQNKGLTKALKRQIQGLTKVLLEEQAVQRLEDRHWPLETHHIKGKA